MRFEGVIPAVLTPFDEDGSVDAATLAGTAGWLIEEGVGGLVGNGTMGEAQSLSASERRLVIETLVAAADGRVPVTAGISSVTPAASIGYAADAAAVGAGSLMLLPPLGYEGDEREVEAFYRTVAEATVLPIMVYNNPKASGTDMGPELVARLAEIDGVVAVKECSGDARRIAAILNETEDFEVLVGGDDWARDVYARILPLARLDMHPKLVQFFKAAMDLVGRGGGPCRPPRLDLTNDERRRVEEAVRALGVEVAG